MSDSPAGGRVWGPWATAAFGAGILAVYAITQALAALVVLLGSAGTGIPDPSDFLDAFDENAGLVLTVSIVLSAVVCLGLIAGIIKLRTGSIYEYLGLNRVTGKTLLVAAGITVAYGALGDWLTNLLGIPVPEWMVKAYSSGVSPLLLGIAIVLFAPAFEETFFRGFLFAGLSRSRIGVAGAIVLTSLVWTALHAAQYGMVELAIVFALGILLGFARFKTGSLWTPLMMHALTNLIATVEMTLKVNGLLG